MEVRESKLIEFLVEAFEFYTTHVAILHSRFSSTYSGLINEQVRQKKNN